MVCILESDGIVESVKKLLLSLTLIISANAWANPTSWSGGGDNGGWIILLVFLGFWVFMGISAFVSSFFSKDKVEEEIKKKK